MWFRKASGSFHDNCCTLSFHPSTNGALPAFHGLQQRRGFKRAIVSGSNITSGQWLLPWERENCVSAIFPSCFRQTPVMREGHIKMCLDWGNTCLTSHIWSTANFASAGGGHQIQDPSGYKNTAWNQSLGRAIFQALPLLLGHHPRTISSKLSIFTWPSFSFNPGCLLNADRWSG